MKYLKLSAVLLAALFPGCADRADQILPPVQQLKPEREDTGSPEQGVLALVGGGDDRPSGQRQRHAMSPFLR